MSKATTLGDYQVLKFDLGAETYCVDIDHVDEIVDADVGNLTTLPNQPDHVEGMVDLRGRTTTVVDPRAALDLDQDGAGRRIVVFDSDDDETIGWLVEEAHQVTDVLEEDVDRTVASDAVLGIVRQDGEFVVWVEPEAVHG